MHNANAQHLLADAQSVPKQYHLIYILNMTLYGMEYPFDQLGSAVLAMSLPSFMCCPPPQLPRWEGSMRSKSP